MHGRLLSVRCKSDGAGFLKRTKARRVFNGKEGVCPLSCKGRAPNVRGTPFAHPVSHQYCPSQNLESRCTPLTSPVAPKIQFLSSHRHLEKELEMTRGVEDHIEYIAFELALGRQHARCTRKGRFGAVEGEGWAKVGRVRCDSVSTG